MRTMRFFAPVGPLLGALLPWSALVPAQTLVIPPTADATVDQSQPSVNFGSDPELGFGKNFTYTPNFSSWPMRAHLQFDLGPIQQSGRWPTRVLLRWYQHRASAAGCLDVSVHRITAAWSEASVTWQTKPSHDLATVARVCVGDAAGTGWKEGDVTALVQDWLLGAVPNHGLVLRDPTESNAGAARPGFAHSRENGNPALVPHLQVEFADRFGFGCSMRGLLPMSDVTAGRPRLGESFTIGTTGVISGSLVGMVFGLSNTGWSGGALPWSLAPIGYPHCEMLVSPDATTALRLIPSTSWEIVWNGLPPNPALDGLMVFMQTLAIPPQPQLGIELSNGVGVTLRR